MEKPEWCDEPDADEPYPHGCWSMLFTPERICKEYCSGCESSHHYVGDDEAKKLWKKWKENKRWK